MIVLIIFIILSFYFYFIQAKNLTNKVDVISKAIHEGKDTYTDPITHRTHSTETGEQVLKTIILQYDVTHKNGRDIVEGEIVLKGVKTGRIYRNYTKEDWVKNIQQHIDNGKCWCYERHAYAQHKYANYGTKFHLKEKYFYRLNKEEYIDRADNYKRKKRFYQIRDGVKTEITEDEYLNLGGGRY